MLSSGQRARSPRETEFLSQVAKLPSCQVAEEPLGLSASQSSAGMERFQAGWALQLTLAGGTCRYSKRFTPNALLQTARRKSIGWPISRVLSRVA